MASYVRALVVNWSWVGASFCFKDAVCRFSKHSSRYFKIPSVLDTRYSILIQPVLKIGLGLSNTRRYAKNFSLVIAPEKMPSYPKAHPIKLFKRNCHIPLFFVLTEILLDLQMRMIIICILRVQSYYETNWSEQSKWITTSKRWVLAHNFSS